MQQSNIPSGHHHQRRGSSALRLGTAASAVAALAALHSPAWAVDYTWRDVSGGVWDDPSRWTLLGVPGSDDSATIGAIGTSDIGTVLVRDARSVGTLYFTNANTKLNSTSTLSVGTLQFGAGRFGTNTVYGGGVMNVSGGATFNGVFDQTIDYSHTINLNGGALWTAGNGKINVGGAYTQGTTTYPTAQLNIAANTTLTDAGAASATGFKTLGFGGAITNNGTYVRNGLGTTVAVALDNRGLIDITSGNFTFSNGNYVSTSSGTVKVAAGSVLNVANTTFTAGSVQNKGVVSLFSSGIMNVVVDAAASIDGAWQINGARGQFEGTHSVATLAINSGWLVGAGVLNAESLAFNGGSIGYNSATGGGTLNINGSSSFDGAAVLTIDYSHTVNLNGSSTWAAGNGKINVGGAYTQGVTPYPTARLNVDVGATFTDAGAATAAGQKNLGFGGSVTNFGTYRREGLGSTYARNFNNAGRLELAGGTLLLDADFKNTGTVAIAAGALLAATTTSLANAGFVSGLGTVKTFNLNSALMNTGTLDPGLGATLGTLTIDGDLTLTDSSVLRIDLSSSGLSDKLAVTDGVLWNGELAVWGGGGTVLQLGSVYTIATYNQRLLDSTFDRISWHGLSPDQFTVAYGFNAITLTVTAVPESASWAFFAVGLLALGTQTWRRQQAAVA